MAGQTPDYGIRFPEMLDPANINVVQHIAEDSESQLGALLDEIVADSAGKANWAAVTWAPTVTGMTLGNGSITGSAMSIGQLVWADFEILPHPTDPPTTAWIANSFPVVALPPSLPVTQTISPGGHNLASARRAIASPNVVNMAIEIAPSNNTLALVAIEGPMRFYNYPAAILGGTAVWGSTDYVRCGFMYLTSAIVS